MEPREILSVEESPQAEIDANALAAAAVAAGLAPSAAARVSPPTEKEGRPAPERDVLADRIALADRIGSELMARLDPRTAAAVKRIYSDVAIEIASRSSR